MKLLKIRDNSRQKKSAFSSVEGLTGKIADKTLEQLEREGVFLFPETVTDMEDMTREQMVLQSVNDAYRSGNVMGFLGWGDERLIIQSRWTRFWAFPTWSIWRPTPIRRSGCFSFCCSCFRAISRPPCGRARSSSISAASITTGT